MKEWFAFLVYLHIQGTWKLVTVRAEIILTLNCNFLRPIRNLNDLTVHINIFLKISSLDSDLTDFFFLRSCPSERAVLLQKSQMVREWEKSSDLGKICLVTLLASFPKCKDFGEFL